MTTQTDTFDTGPATVDAAADRPVELQLARVHLRLGSPPITGPCHYGIDTPTREELIGATHSIEEIREFLGVDSLGYLSLDGMLTAAGKEDTGFCHACFSGHYPTTTPDDLVQLRHAMPALATPA